MQNALGALRLGGKAGFVGVQAGELVLDPIALIGKTAVGILEGNTDPHTFIPRMIELWQAGRFPFDRLIEEFPLAEINEAEAASLSGRVIRSEEHTSELQSLMRISYAVFCLKKKKTPHNNHSTQY